MFCFDSNCECFKWYLNNYSSCIHCDLLPQEVFSEKDLIISKNHFLKGSAISHEYHTPNFLIEEDGVYEITLKIIPLTTKMETTELSVAFKANHQILENSLINIKTSQSNKIDGICFRYIAKLSKNTSLSIALSENIKINLSHIVIAKIQ